MSEIEFSRGSHQRLAQPVIGTRVSVTDGLRIELSASIAEPQEGRSAWHPLATTLAIHMDQLVASALFQQLRETFLTMGWPLPR